MELIKLSNSELISSFKRLVKVERKITHFVLCHIIEVENRRLHLEMGYDRMYSYLTKELGYSEYAAYERLRAAELLKKLPEVSEKIESGALNLTQITELQKCLRTKAASQEVVPVEKVKEAISALEYQNGFNTQKYLAQEFDLPLQQHECTRPQKDESVRLEITLTKEEFLELQKAKEYLSTICPSGKWSDVIIALARKLNKMKEGKAAIQTLKSHAAPTSRKGRIFDDKTTQGLMVSSVPNNKVVQEQKCDNVSRTELQPVTAPYRPYISIKTKRELLNKAKHQCEYIHRSTGPRCSSKYQLQIDHKVPLARNGSHDIANLRVLCGSHNRYEALKWNLPRKHDCSGNF